MRVNGHGGHSTAATAERGRPGSLVAGALIFRWVWLAWMVALTLSSPDAIVEPGWTWTSIGAAAAMTVWLTLARRSVPGMALWLDLALSTWLVIASGLFVERGAVVSGRPFLATGYPLSTPLLWGALRGWGAGLATGSLLALAHLLSRPANGVPLNELSSEQLQNLAGAMLNYLVAGLAMGLVSGLLARSAALVQRANAEVVREREHSARLAERESLARQIHDSVLQALALVHKRGRELAAAGDVPANEVAKLSEVAATQERELRALILRGPERAPLGDTALREELEAAVRAVTGVPVQVSSVGPVFVPRSVAAELTAAVRQAVENAAEHSGASRVSVFAEREDGGIAVSVRDDGVGFDFDERALAAAGKLGILKSMKGRIEDLGGKMQITSAPGSGTEIEFTVPAVETHG